MESDIIKEELEKHGYMMAELAGTGKTADCFLVKKIQYNHQFICKCIQEMKEKAATVVFHNELDALIRLDHENIIRCYDYFSAQGFFFIFLEYCKEGSLQDLIERSPQYVKENLWDIAQQIISALSYSHQNGVCHLDLKPSNILINQYKKIKLCDFGFCYTFKSDEKFDLNSYNPIHLNRRGSPQFMAPEVYRQEEEGYDPFKADIWSLGVVLFEMATAEKKHQYTDIRKMWRELFKECSNLGKIGKIIQQCVVVDPGNRPSIVELEKIFLQAKPPSHHIKRTPNSCCFSASRKMSRSLTLTKMRLL